MNFLSLFQTNQHFHCFEFHDLARRKTQDLETELRTFQILVKGACKKIALTQRTKKGKESTSLADTR